MTDYQLLHEIIAHDRMVDLSDFEVARIARTLREVSNGRTLSKSQRAFYTRTLARLRVR